MYWSMAAVLLFASASALAMDGEPVPTELDPAQRTMLGVTVGKDSLSEAHDKIGKAKRTQIGEGTCRETILCYTSSRASDPTKLLFSANADYSLRGEITSVQFTSDEFVGPCADARSENVAACAPSMRIGASLRTSGGLKLGMTKDQVRALLGPEVMADTSSEDALFYNYWVEKRLDESEIRRLERQEPNIRRHPYYGMSSSIDAYFRDDRLYSFEISTYREGL